ncbi:MAG: alpha/beta hydrolase family protein [Anaerolineae bacterium]
MFNFLDVGLAVSYLLSAFVSIVGVIQIVAARRQLVGLSLTNRWPQPTTGYILGSILLAGAILFFFGTQWSLILVPGLAGAEFSLLFGLALLGALMVTLSLASILGKDRWGTSSLATNPDGRVHCEAASLDLGQALFCLPSPATAPLPAVCAIPRPGDDGRSLHHLAQGLIQHNFAVLILDLSDMARLRYPEVLALVPRAISTLSQRDEIDADRIGVLGLGLGGDLAIRAASADKQIRTVVALAPLFKAESFKPGLGMLKEMTCWQAMRWTRLIDRTALCASLEIPSHVTELSPRQLLLLYGQEDELTSPAYEVVGQDGGMGKVVIVEGERHFTLATSSFTIQQVVAWFAEHL